MPGPLMSSAFNPMSLRTYATAKLHNVIAPVPTPAPLAAPTPIFAAPPIAYTEGNAEDDAANRTKLIAAAAIGVVAIGLVAVKILRKRKRR